MSEPLARRAGAAVSWRAVAVVTGKAITLVRYAILARLLAPADFGLLALALVPLDVLTSVTNVGMNPALVQRRDIGGRHYDVAWTLGVARALAISAVVLAGAPLIAALLAEPRATNVLRVLALRPLLGAVASVRVADLERELDFRRLCLIDVGAALAAAVVSIALARRLGVWALVSGTLAGAVTGAALSYLAAPHRPRLAFDRDAARSLFRFGRWVLLGGVVGVAGETILRAVISRRLGTADVGLYFLAATLAAAPNEIVSSLVGAVAFPVHARLQAEARRARDVFAASLVAMAAVLAPAYAVLVALAPSLVQHVLGPQWEGSARVIRLLAVGGLLGVMFDATAPMLQGRGKPQQVTALFAVLSATVAALGWVLADRFGLLGAAMAWVAAEAAVFATCVVFARQMLAQPFAGLAGPMAVVAAAAAAAAGAAWAPERVQPGLAGLVGGAGVAAAVAVGTLLLLDRRFEVGLARDFARAFPALAARMRLTTRAV